MKFEESSAWLAAIAAERGATAGSVAGARGGAGPGEESRRREDALGASGHERVEAQGCPHCASRQVIG